MLIGIRCSAPVADALRSEPFPFHSITHPYGLPF
jgi:hypothetical protein